jgi:beta-mannosidase
VSGALSHRNGWRPIDVQWTLARLDRPDAEPERWIPASVPGAVQLDWARANGLPDPNYGNNVRLYDGLEDAYWLYRTRVPSVPLAAGQTLVLACGGVDYECEVRLEGRVVHRHVGLFTPFEVDLRQAPASAPLDILIWPAPKRPGAPPDRSQASDVCKPAVSYGWDWHPRLIPLGLWAGAALLVRPIGALGEVDFAYTLDDALGTARITVAAGPGARWRLLERDGALAAEGAEAPVELARPRLWWTHDQGEPELYRLEVAGPAGDSLVRQVGFRRVRLLMAEGAWDHPQGFPKSRSHPPITLELNGRTLFAKGTNWVNPELFPCLVTAERLRPLLQLARHANFNLLRSWGGAIVNPEPFFEQCDALGILVWQEFPLACNRYPDDPAYLRVLDQESRSIIRRVRQHPCLGIWSGGNELFNAWSGMTDQALPLRLLNRNCYDLDPATPFIPTAPLDGMGHGDYRFCDDQGREVFEIFQRAGNTAYSEFGCPGPSPADYLIRYIPEAKEWPPRPGTSWETHHGFGAWEADPSTWLCLPTLERYFGPTPDLETMCRRGAWLQALGLQAIYEEARRQKPACAMALYWCFNEPWPTAAGPTLLNWPAEPKPGYEAARLACRPVLASARFAKFEWRPGEAFAAELWILNDSPSGLEPGELEATLEAGGIRVALGRWAFPEVSAGRNLRGPRVEGPVPEAGSEAFELRLSVAFRPEWATRYRLRLLPGDR